ncbi:STAS domain-containing protein [Actinokineospora sp. NPDC004072]
MAERATVAVLVTLRAAGPAARVCGALDATTTAAALAELTPLLRLPGRTLELDLSEVAFCDTAGLRMLIDLRTTVAAQGKTLVIADRGAVVARMLELTGTEALFP